MLLRHQKKIVLVYISDTLGLCLKTVRPVFMLSEGSYIISWQRVGQALPRPRRSTAGSVLSLELVPHSDCWERQETKKHVKKKSHRLKLWTNFHCTFHLSSLEFVNHCFIVPAEENGWHIACTSKMHWEKWTADWCNRCWSSINQYIFFCPVCVQGTSCKNNSHLIKLIRWELLTYCICKTWINGGFLWSKTKMNLNHIIFSPSTLRTKKNIWLFSC